MRYTRRVLRVFRGTRGCVVLLGLLAVGLVASPGAAEFLAYVTYAPSRTVTVINTETNTVVDSIQASAPHGVAITPDGTRAYVANISTNSVSVIDTNPWSSTHHTVVATVKTPSSANYAVAITPDGRRAYVTDRNNTVSVINTATNTVVATVKVSRPYNVAFTPEAPGPT